LQYGAGAVRGKRSTRCALALAVTGLSLLTAGSALAAAVPEIRVLSNRADLVSGGQALVEVVPAAGTTASRLGVRLNGRDVGPSFALRPGGRYIALLDGLRDGRNTLTAGLPGERRARLRITNHPLGGPVIDGPQIQPWKCREGASDSQCNREPKYEFSYKSTSGGGLRPYNPDNPPSDVATTTTDQGKTVPYIVRQEIGAIDRDEYRIAVLYDPSKPWEPWAPQDGFNGKLVVNHGASCDTHYQQGDAPAVLNETALSRGFAVMSHALDNAGHNCNILTQAESLIMTKERVIEQHGEIRYTIGTGCSGGALVQQQVANAYPGFYQGITPGCSFPDAWSSAMLYVDYVLLRRYFEEPRRWGVGVVWGPDDVQAVEGHPNPINAVTFTTAIPYSGEPTRSCTGVPQDQVYDESSNPNGVRCTLQDYMVNIFGRRARSSWGPVEQQLGRGFAGRPFDNVGIEYGRKALANGTITAAQFVDLNTKIGAGDIDSNEQRERVAADRPALERVYRSGAVNQATHLDRVAIIDLRGPDPGAFHDVYRTYALRARLEREHGHANNQVLWRGQVPLVGDANFASEAILAMDGWLAAIEADSRDIPLARKIVEDKPESLRERCTDGDGHELPAAQCDATVQSYSTARIEAGMSSADDTIKCELQPLSRSSYAPIEFTDAQWAELETTFPDGVCDYSRPGVDRVPTVPWLTYRDGPGGRPLGAAPTSRRLSRKGKLRLISRRCVTGRRLGLRLRARGRKLRRARLYVNGRRTSTRRGRGARRRIVLRGLPGGTVRVRAVAHTRSGKRLVARRRYRACG
jgi:Tannase-like family of unknown function (DUF6351)